MIMPVQRPLLALPFTLTLAMTEWASLTTACACAKHASASWSPPETPLRNAQLAQAVQREATLRLREFLNGIKRYHDSSYRRTVVSPPVIWRKGSACLLDYTRLCAGNMALLPPLLLIPSLINRYYILDLDEKKSFARYLSAQGIPCLILDWGEPEGAEMAYNCADYVTEILVPALNFIVASTGQKAVLGGYCMGGVLATALGLICPALTAGIALLATPWDFCAPGMAHLRLNNELCSQIEAQLSAEEKVPASLIHLLFCLQNPIGFQQKFRRFAQMPEGKEGAKIRAFMALESWVNDGVPMAAAVAKECLLDWTQHNTLHSGYWEVKGSRINPSGSAMRVFAAIPKSDQIVPKSCAMPLAQAMNASIIYPGAGHVSMVVGEKAKRELWEPFVAWYRQFLA